MICVPPFRGELGLLIRFHAPAVAALPRPLTVCCEPGMEALYPNAEHTIVDPREDALRKDLYRKDADYVAAWTEKLKAMYPGCTIVAPDRSQDWPMTRFVPEPVKSYGLKTDVVVCPRKREVAPERNWPHWPELVDELNAMKLRVWAAGAAQTSDTSVDCYGSWHWPRPLDAAIDLMRSARLVIATDAGMAHLAVLCGAPLLIIGCGDLPAPGAKWKVRMQEYFEDANHMNAPIRLFDGWHDPVAVAREVRRTLQVAA